MRDSRPDPHPATPLREAQLPRYLPPQSRAEEGSEARRKVQRWIDSLQAERKTFWGVPSVNVGWLDGRRPQCCDVAVWINRAGPGISIVRTAACKKHNCRGHGSVQRRVIGSCLIAAIRFGNVPGSEPYVSFTPTDSCRSFFLPCPASTKESMKDKPETRKIRGCACRRRHVTRCCWMRAAPCLRALDLKHPLPLCPSALL